MDLTNIVTFINAVGFPIAACCAMAYFFAKVNANYREDIKELQCSHRDEIKSLTEVVSNNTLVLQKLVDRIDDFERDTERVNDD